MSGASSVPALLRQGDVLLVPVAGIPDLGVVDSERTASRHALAEGAATGHAHVVVGGTLRLTQWRRSRRWAAPERRTFLVVDDVDATLVHEEHLPLVVARGTYEVRRQREYRSGGWARVSD